MSDREQQLMHIHSIGKKRYFGTVFRIEFSYQSLLPLQFPCEQPASVT